MNPAYFIVPLALAVVIALDWWIAHTVWRKVSQPVESNAAAITGGAGCALAFGVAVLVLALGAVVLGTVWLYSRASARAQMNASRITMEDPRFDASVMPAVPAPYPTPSADEFPPVVVPPANAEAISAETRAQQLVLETQLREAQSGLTRLQKQVDAGLASIADLDALKEEVAVLQAEQASDPVKVAEVRVQWAQKRLEDLRPAYEQGLISADDYEKAKSTIVLRNSELEAARSKKAAPVESPPKPVETVTEPVPAPSHAHDDLEARLHATKLISSWMTKDAALNTLAQDAANQDATDIVLEALSAISSWETRDSAARNAARTIARRGHRDDAIKVAKLISSAMTRDSTLSELSK